MNIANTRGLDDGEGCVHYRTVLRGHFASSIVIAFLIEADSFPYGMQRSKGTIYLNTLQMMDGLLGLPLDINHNAPPMLINSIVCTTTLAFALIGFKMVPWRKVNSHNESHTAE